MKTKRYQYDVAVIGGGPAGLMAACMAAQNQAQVVLIEKNPMLGRKLLITGKGRCNLTTAETDIRKFIKTIGENGAFLFSALNAFSTSQTIDFFQELGVPIKIERGQRVFPVSDRSADIVNALTEYLNKHQVTIIKNNGVKKIEFKNKKIDKIILDNGQITAKNYILATGGLSYPETGCSGQGYQWAKELGHHLNQTRPGLVPIIVKEKWVKALEGLGLKNVTISVWQNNKKIAEKFGEALFTAEGLSGPIVLDLSNIVGKLLGKDSVFLKINFKPALDSKTLDQRLQKDIAEAPNEYYKNFLGGLLPKKMVPVFLTQSKISSDLKAGQMTKAQRQTILKLLTEFTLEAEKLTGFNKAIITLGGVELKEIDPKTMKSKIVPNLFFAGEIIDVHGPTGGYNLQICFATGYLAGSSAAKE